MRDEAESPIIVTGLGRSGSTWMQWFLSQHPRIHIHGQSPNLPWDTLWHCCQTLIRQGEWARAANQRIGYQIAHYAGTTGANAEDLFRRCIRDFMCGFGPAKPRWGMKWIGLCEQAGAVCQFQSLWPAARFVVCLRDPFATINSLKNTFAPAVDPQAHATNWVNTCKFIETDRAGRVVTVQMDKLQERSPIERRAAMAEVMECIGETPSRPTDEFIQRWETVHKVTADEERTFQLSSDDKKRLMDDVPELAHYISRWGYGPYY